MKILFAGIIARYPFGGVTWCSLMYLLGLRALGHEVLYLEDTGECIYDPERNEISPDPSYGTRYIHNALEPFGLGDRWCFVNYDDTYHGSPLAIASCVKPGSESRKALWGMRRYSSRQNQEPPERLRKRSASAHHRRTASALWPW